MFSTRLPRDLASNRLTLALEERKRRGVETIDLTASNPTHQDIDYPRDLLAPLADARALRYDPHPFGLQDARAAVAHDYRRRHVDIDPRRVVLTASTSEAYSLLFKLLADAGDELLVPRPSYPLFDHLACLDLVTPRPYDLEYHGRWQIDFASVERAMTARTRAILVVSPNNPTGSFIDCGELERLDRLAAERGIAIVADEVFADYELEAGALAAAGQVSSARSTALTFALGGFSKSVGLPQLKLGWIVVAGPPALVDGALKRLELIADTYLSVSTPVQVAAAELLARGGEVRARIRERVRDNYAALKAAAAGVASCSVLRSDGGWYAVLHVPTFEPEEELTLRLLARDGVLAHPGYFFDFPAESFLIVSLLPRPDRFAAGITRILRHFDCTHEAHPHG
jgi:aspartate/methionine/tyrosine aminotransferase